MWRFRGKDGGEGAARLRRLPMSCRGCAVATAATAADELLGLRGRSEMGKGLVAEPSRSAEVRECLT